MQETNETQEQNCVGLAVQPEAMHERLVMFAKLEKLLLCCNMVRIGNLTNSVRIEFGKVGKEGLSEIVYHDGTIEGLVDALEKASESTDYKGNT